MLVSFLASLGFGHELSVGVSSFLLSEVPLSAWFNVLCDAVRPFLCPLLLLACPRLMR